MRISAASALVLVLGAAQVSSATVSGRQAAYDAAQAAYDRGDWATAAAGFAPLLPSDPARPIGHSGAIVAIRLGEARLQLDQLAEAEASARRGVAALPETDALALAQGWTTIADAERFGLDYDGARAAYDKAMASAVRSGSVDLQRSAAAGLALVLATVDPAAAAAPLDALLDDQSKTTTIDGQTRATIEELRARIALNAGDLVTAQRLIDKAIQHSGGGTGTRVNQLQIAIRGDASIVAKRRNDDETMRRYLTFSGAGHLESSSWIGNVRGDLPVCDATEVKPDDVAVVQMSLATDGHVLGVAPVYASRPGTVGLTFARAVAGWTWNPDAIRKVNPFWLQGLRLELRCETRPTPDRLGKPVAQIVAAWLADRHPEAAGTVAIDGDRSRTPDGLAGLRLLAAWESGDLSQIHTIDVKPKQIAATGDAPPEAYALALHFAAGLGQSSSLRGRAREMAASLGAAVPAFVARYPASIASPWLLVEWGNVLERSGDFAAARAPLEQALATPVSVLPEDAAIRQVATLHLAMVRRQLGDASGADATIRAAGLDAAQCSLVDTKPVPTNLSVVSSQFPMDALRWHFEGYARVAYDIAADGHVANIRTVLAYPPFVFGPGTERAARSFRYAAPTIEGKPVGCTGETQSVSYQIPH